MTCEPTATAAVPAALRGPALTARRYVDHGLFGSCR
ncbi:hypothetical protein C5N14_16885 [Micromonospora sp. MW-13]|nr:hypothetical protein C5N14_16885 [Micromonospora sp. MW-13]